jgi:adenylosuccinate synthase
MTESVFTLLTKLARVSCLACVIAASVIAAQGQRPSSLDPDKRDDAQRPFVAAEEEMRAKVAIRGADKEYQENLGRARDLSFLGNSIVTSFKQKNTLDREDVKKLDRVEKLAKGIRRAAGGEEEEVKLEKSPQDLASALDMLGEMTKSLKEKVEKTPKHVISAAVIAEANALLELIRIVRTLPPQV